MPWYCGGLWDAVNIAPGRLRAPDAKYTRSVDTSPRSIDVTSGVGDATDERGGHRLARHAHVASDEDGVVHEVRERAADAVGGVLVELVRIHAADVVGLEDLRQVRHGITQENTRVRSRYEFDICQPTRIG